MQVLNKHQVSQTKPAHSFPAQWGIIIDMCAFYLQIQCVFMIWLISWFIYNLSDYLAVHFWLYCDIVPDLCQTFWAQTHHKRENRPKLLKLNQFKFQ